MISFFIDFFNFILSFLKNRESETEAQNIFIIYPVRDSEKTVISTWHIHRHPFVGAYSAVTEPRTVPRRQKRAAMESLAFATWRSCVGLNRRRAAVASKASIRPPPPGFDYKLQVLEDTRSAVEKDHPELIDLVEKGRLVVVEKKRFGPVPSWRTAFVEPETIWIVGTSHISAQSSVDVERVIKAVAPDNVVVELCRSRQRSFTYFSLIPFLVVLREEKN